MKSRPLFPYIQSVLLIALPICAGRVLHLLASFFAMMMVARFGKDPLAAGFLAVSSTIPVTTSIVTIFYATGIQIRYYLGRNENLSDIGTVIKNSLFLAVILAIPAALCISHMDIILLAIGLEPEVVLLTKGYFLYAGVGVFPLLAMTVIGQFYVGIGKPRFALLIEIVSFPLTILASWCLVLGHCGLSPAGLSGVSLATLIVQSALLIATLMVTYRNRNNAVYFLFTRSFAFNWRICQSILAMGFPIGIQFGGELAAIAVASWLMGYYGVDALAALQIASQYSILIIMLSIGLTQALSLKVSEVYGQNRANNQVIKTYLIASLMLLMCYVMPVAILFCTLSTQFAEFYMGTSNLRPDFKHLIHVFFILSALFLFLDGIRNLLTGTLRGLHNSKTASMINLASLWLVSIPVSGIIIYIFKGDPIALRVGFLSGFIVAVISLVWLLQIKLYPRNVTLQHCYMEADQ